MTSRPPLSRTKRLFYGCLFAIAAVLLAFGLLEVALRLTGFGRDPAFFRHERAADGSRWIRENRDFALTYFPRALVRRPQAFRLPAEKAADSYRIFILGSSAAMGDPEASFSIARLLEAMLREAYPQVRFEVVNAAITAINSHVTRAVAADCAKLKPDLFIVYEGHNEVIGPYGPAAVLAPFRRSPSAVAFAVGLKRTRIGQLLGTLAPTGDLPDDWGGMQMFLEHEIAVDDPRLDDVRASFAENLRAIIRAAEDDGARTLLCTVLTNQKDFAPFLSRPAENLDETARIAWQQAFDDAGAAASEGDWNAAEEKLREAWTIDPQYAEVAFRLGRIALARGRDQEAATLLQRALDLDRLRFRTDSRLNETIREVAAASPATAELVDLAHDVASTSPHGILGDEVLYEHVHLTFRGTWETSRILFDRVSEELARRRLIRTVASPPFSYDLARTRLAFTTYEQAMIFHELRRRFARPPFTGQSDHALRTATWDQRAAAADGLLQRTDSRAALTMIYEQAIVSAPDDWVLKRNLGMMLVSQGAPERALVPLEAARVIIPDDADLLFALGTALRAAHRESEARTVFGELRKLEPAYPGLASSDASGKP